MKWVCKVCGYVHEGEQPPEECPLCGVGPDQFEKEEEQKTKEKSCFGNSSKFVENSSFIFCY